MPKLDRIRQFLPIILIGVICGCTRISAPNNPSRTTTDNPSNLVSKADKNAYSSLNATNPKDEPEKDIRVDYLMNKILTQEEYIKRLDNLDAKYQKAQEKLWSIITVTGIIVGIIVGIFSFLSILGIKRLSDVDDIIIKTKDKLDTTMNIFNVMEKGIIEKEKELHEKFDGIIGQTDKHEYNCLDKANYLDYEHKLYFANVYLPITKDTQKYKKSLFILGAYWIDTKNYGRALLRFKEIDRIQYEIDSKKIPFFESLPFAFKKTGFEERILGNKTAKFFNLYGIALKGCAQDPTTDSDEKKSFTATAEEYFLKAISLNPNYASPYYNTGLLYGTVKNDDNIALEWYQKAIGKIPDLSVQTYRNMACCKVRLGKPLEEIIAILNNVPAGDPYWEKIINDDVLNPKIKSAPELRRFIETKYPQLKLT